MSRGKEYQLSLLPMGIFLASGLLILLIGILAIAEAVQESAWQTIKAIGLTLVFPTPFIAYPIYLWRKRKAGKTFYWDEEGIVIDLQGNKVYWDEIEDIRFFRSYYIWFSKSTVIYPHYTHHEKIRERRKKWMPTPGHSIDWILIENPKDYHKNVMQAWKEKQKLDKNKWELGETEK
ncbi:hypothetical protein [Planomicrobium okeanokoites]|uniref:Uncharacterized protein n=1 Tax=Planomicrobium okeanokoites TaxID=244 RepID=A0ABV7KT92_PLAOK|nr:hypothetical protein [Planomicrobium okeanokoites]